MQISSELTLFIWGCRRIERAPPQEESVSLYLFQCPSVSLYLFTNYWDVNIGIRLYFLGSHIWAITLHLKYQPTIVLGTKAFLLKSLLRRISPFCMQFLAMEPHFQTFSHLTAKGSCYLSYNVTETGTIGVGCFLPLWNSTRKRGFMSSKRFSPLSCLVRIPMKLDYTTQRRTEC